MSKSRNIALNVLKKTKVYEAKKNCLFAISWKKKPGWWVSIFYFVKLILF